MFLKNFGCIMLKELIIYLELRKKPGEGNGNPLQHSCLENPMDRGAWRAAVRGVSESDRTEQPAHNCFRAQTVFCLLRRTQSPLGLLTSPSSPLPPWWLYSLHLAAFSSMKKHKEKSVVFCPFVSMSPKVSSFLLPAVSQYLALTIFFPFTSHRVEIRVRFSPPLVDNCSRSSLTKI